MLFAGDCAKRVPFLRNPVSTCTSPNCGHTVRVLERESSFNNRNRVLDSPKNLRILLITNLLFLLGPEFRSRNVNAVLSVTGSR